MRNYASWLDMFGMQDTIKSLGITVVNDRTLKRQLVEYYNSGIISDQLFKIIATLITRCIDKKYKNFPSILDRADLIHNALVGILETLLPSLKRKRNQSLNMCGAFRHIVIVYTHRLIYEQIKHEQIKADYITITGLGALYD
jgi:hypothetical protein